MKFPSALATLLFLPTLFVFSNGLSATVTDFWPQWRGPWMNGMAPEGSNPPLEWSEDKNVKWKVEVPGSGLSTPIVWGNRIFLLTAIEVPSEPSPEAQAEAAAEAPAEEPSEGRRRRRGGAGDGGGEATAAYEFTVLALDRSDGSLVWKRVARKEVPHEGIHGNGSWASGSPMTDGQHLYAYFGSRGLYCYDFEGNLKWEKDFGDMRIRKGFGEGNSPSLWGDTILVNWDHEGDSFLVALDKKSGQEVWKSEREETTSWATPVVVDTGETRQIVTNATERVRGYDFATGKLLWEVGGMTENTVATPVWSGDRVIVASGFRGAAMLAIDLSKAEGDLTGTEAIAWKVDKGTPYLCSPLLDDNLLFMVQSRDAVLSCVDVRTGEFLIDRERLPDRGEIYASMVGAQDRVYVLGREGTMTVLKQGPKFEVLASNTLEGIFGASPAVVGNEMYLRSDKHLYCLAEE